VLEYPLPLTSSRISTVARNTEAIVLLVAIHISEDPEDSVTKDLINYLEPANIPTSILGIFKTNSTFVLVELMDLVFEFMPPF
jgi:hypothetical protein